MFIYHMSVNWASNWARPFSRPMTTINSLTNMLSPLQNIQRLNNQTIKLLSQNMHQQTPP
ncbi:hypothetical protein HanIR_Chr06g0282581 [Helianthus annuus]|nr:hypothetical protein HanIR_Chr06g0282581 [Helianthus annuus]